MTAVYDPTAYRTFFERDFTYLSGFRRNTSPKVCRPTVFVYDTELTTVLSDALDRVDHRPPIIVAVGDAEPIRIAGATVIRYRELLVDPPVRLPDPGGSVWDETTRLYTSGTTGLPKAVPLTIVGRKDDMLLSGGENVHPVQVEEVPQRASPGTRLPGRRSAGPEVGAGWSSRTLSPSSPR